MNHYKQLTYEQRCQIEVLKKSGLSQQAIADAIGTSQSSVSRELARNTGDRGYRHEQAQRRTVQRRREAHRAYKMTEELIGRIEHYVRQNWSPEQISGRLLTHEMIDISHERIYQHIWIDKARGGDLHTHMRRKGKKYQHRGSTGKTSRGQIKNRVSINDRPVSVDQKVEVGHWEIDTVIGKSHSGALVTIVERRTMFTLSQRVNSKSAEDVTAATIALLEPFKDLVLSITSDNGKEFAYHEKISTALACDFYFAHPYHSWERGLNENTNGLLRQDFPKDTDFKTVKQNDVKRVVAKLNDRPRKTLAFEKPADLMAKEMAALAA